MNGASAAGGTAAPVHEVHDAEQQEQGEDAGEQERLVDDGLRRLLPVEVEFGEMDAQVVQA